MKELYEWKKGVKQEEEEEEEKEERERWGAKKMKDVLQ